MASACKLAVNDLAGAEVRAVASGLRQRMACNSETDAGVRLRERLDAAEVRSTCRLRRVPLGAGDHAIGSNATRSSSRPVPGVEASCDPARFELRDGSVCECVPVRAVAGDALRGMPQILHFG